MERYRLRSWSLHSCCTAHVAFLDSEILVPGWLIIDKQPAGTLTDRQTLSCHGCLLIDRRRLPIAALPILLLVSRFSALVRLKAHASSLLRAYRPDDNLISLAALEDGGVENHPFQTISDPIDPHLTTITHDGVGRSLVPATADSCIRSARIANYGTLDPGEPVAALLGSPEAALAAGLQAQHHPDHSIPRHEPEESAASWPTQVPASSVLSRGFTNSPSTEVVKGTVNDPAPVPAPSASHGHYHWTFERGMAAALVPLTLTPFASGSLNPTLDAILVGTLLVHSHLGLQAIIIDYVNTWGYPMLRKFCMWALNVATILAGIGLYEFETTDVGIVEATKRLWKA